MNLTLSLSLLDKDITPTVNLWISSDFNSHSGLQLAWEALSFIVSFVHLFLKKGYETKIHVFITGR